MNIIPSKKKNLGSKEDVKRLSKIFSNAGVPNDETASFFVILRGAFVQDNLANFLEELDESQINTLREENSKLLKRKQEKESQDLLLALFKEATGQDIYEFSEKSVYEFSGTLLDEIEKNKTEVSKDFFDSLVGIFSTWLNNSTARIMEILYQ